jgi:hypothetical protein
MTSIVGTGRIVRHVRRIHAAQAELFQQLGTIPGIGAKACTDDLGTE